MKYEIGDVIYNPGNATYLSEIVGYIEVGGLYVVQSYWANNPSTRTLPAIVAPNVIANMKPLEKCKECGHTK